MRLRPTVVRPSDSNLNWHLILKERVTADTSVLLRAPLQSADPTQGGYRTTCAILPRGSNRRLDMQVVFRRKRNRDDRDRAIANPCDFPRQIDISFEERMGLEHLRHSAVPVLFACWLAWAQGSGVAPWAVTSAMHLN